MSFTYLRIIVWLLVLRDTINWSMQLLYVVDYCHSVLFSVLNDANRAFLETAIDIVEFVGLCLNFAADNSSFSFIQVSQLMLIIFGSFNCNLKIDFIPFNPIFNSFSRILSFLDFNCHIN